jgi:hypothetical protein
VRKIIKKIKGGNVMPDYISRQILKIKALDRWENEGGSICADRTGIIKGGSMDVRASKDNAGKYPKARRQIDSKGEKIKKLVFED